MTYRVVAFDLDGTLLDSRRRIRDDTLAALREVREKGLKVIVVTGRHHVAAHAYHDLLGLETPIICCNGAYVFDYAQAAVLAANPLKKDQARALVALSRRHGLHNFVYTEDAMTFEDENDHVKGLRVWAEDLPARVKPTMRKVDNFEEVIEQALVIWKLVISHPVTAVLDAGIAEMKRDVEVSYESSWHNRMDVAQLGNSKGGRLAEWVRGQGIEMADVIAFGDSDNDISMLTQAGVGVAMGNSVDEVKACANWVTSGNDGDGIAAALRR
ncbi:MAG TPA: pyridoxal phosphatase, partial [Telmatospirillum sp.]|nr:pyridoxal phosphatase [Telmatospirillum sp.]